MVMRISYFGRMEVDLLHGEGSDGRLSVFVSIHRGHMRLLQPESPTRRIQSLRQEQEISRELTVEPWTEALDNSRLEDRQQQKKRPYRVGEPASQPPASLESCLASLDPRWYASKASSGVRIWPSGTGSVRWVGRMNQGAGIPRDPMWGTTSCVAIKAT